MKVLKKVCALLLLITACNAVPFSPTTIATTNARLPNNSTIKSRISTTRFITTTPLPPSECPNKTGTVTPLSKLRNTLMDSRYSFVAFIVFHTDEHLSNEPSPDESRLKYISGWDGPGTAAVLADGDMGAIWVSTDDVTRAKSILNQCFWLVIDADDINQPTLAAWLLDQLRRPKHRLDQPRVGADARHVPYETWLEITSELQQGGIYLIHEPILLDQVWKDENDFQLRKPEFSKIVAHLSADAKSGPSWREKVALVRSELKNLGAEAMIVTALDEVAWLLNIRGRDMPTAPLLKAFVYIGAKDLSVYIPPGKLSMPVREALNMCFVNNNVNCTRVPDYQKVYIDLRATKESKILVPARGTFQNGASYLIAQSIPQSKRVYQISPIIYLKAQKTPTEARDIVKAHLKDAVAMCTLLSYLESRVKQGLNEKMVAMKVDETRATQAGYIGISMNTRVAFGPNGAELNYFPTQASNRKITTNSTLIIESGGQYDEGTTVVTRTVHYGTPSKAEKLAYTTVLRSLFALSTLLAPAALPAAHADVAARAPLWAQKQDYPHPTGHGVGAGLNRIEDPVVIDYRQDANLHTFRERYFVTSNPAWYEPKRFGVKLGNVLEVIGKPNGFLTFKESTLVPFEPQLIDPSLLTDYEINWLNTYNDRIRKTVGPELSAQGLMDVLNWMDNKTKNLPLRSEQKKSVNAANENTLSYVFMIITVVNIYNVFQA